MASPQTVRPPPGFRSMLTTGESRAFSLLDTQGRQRQHTYLDVVVPQLQVKVGGY